MGPELLAPVVGLLGTLWVTQFFCQKIVLVKKMLVKKSLGQKVLVKKIVQEF